MNSYENIGIFIRDVDLTIINAVTDQLKPFNLAPEQNLIMLLLWEQEGYTPNEIAEQLKKDRGSITRMIYRLETKDYIRRESDKKDRRSFKVYLTEKGKELGKEVIPFTQSIGECLTNGITEEELNTLTRTLMKIKQNALNIGAEN
ncbi:MarR family winged helix-turn-helix transcriptional regulator [Thalassobacillus devorans]|uniref:MarR family winged helix-turn-helix transcriptional regulator n=1 Tax=Thalassobacillus devorans TaxID=279813 RepID=UPI000A1CEEF3|nr:MarR family transcriptional regulator [Thalassobacillus devorans]